MSSESFRGYCSPNEFGGYKIPIPMQNTLYRDYVSKNNLVFMLSINELYFKDCYIQLNDLILKSINVNGILMCSMFMMPKDNEYRNYLFNESIKNNTEIHFILENIIFKDENDIETLNKTYILNSVVENILPVNDFKKILLD